MYVCILPDSPFCIFPGGGLELEPGSYLGALVGATGVAVLEADGVVSAVIVLGSLRAYSRLEELEKKTLALRVGTAEKKV